VALKNLAHESQLESKSMCDLTVSDVNGELRGSVLTVASLQARSTKDAAAVKVLTIISLVYLPTTIVAVSSPVFQTTSTANV
jgi:hypothetical protein